MPKPVRAMEFFKAYRFKVEIEGVIIAGCTEVNGLDSISEAMTIRAGDDPLRFQKCSGLMTFSNLVLKRGACIDKNLYDWRKEIEQNGANGFRRDLSIILLDDKEQGAEVARWNIYDAWPVKIDYSPLNSKENGFLFETIELAHEKLERK